MSFIETYERQLVEAAERRRDAQLSRRLRRRLAGRVRVPRRRGPAIVLAALLVAVPATAATTGWNPFASAERNARFPAPTLSQRAPEARLTDQLGVLRRPQTAADRGAVSSAAIRELNVPGYAGAQLDSVRLVDAGRKLVLVPFERAGVPTDPQGRPLPGFDPAAYTNVVCVFERGSDGFAGVGCHSAAKIERGLAISSDGDGVSGLVPDDVARVRLIRGGDSAEAEVTSNVWTAAAPAPVAPERVEWLAADGRVVKRIDLTAPPGER